MIQVTVKLFPPLRTNRFAEAAVELEAPATVTSLLVHLSIKPEHVESIYINGREAGFGHSLAEGDKVSFLPSIGGG
ncbi:MAG: MoaD/ThiS family protein [Desulfofustis sp.]|jgi:molybdopterin converting factor small subunit|nr:MoaD/ThiS family protein [Desulfofustis sp.]